MPGAASTVKAATTTADRASAVKVVAASAVKAVSAVEIITSASSTTEPFVTTEPVVTVPVTIPTTAMIPVAPMVPIPMTIVVAPAIIRVTVEAMEPRAGANEHAVHEVIRSPISVRRASVRSIRVVAVGAHWRRPNRYANWTNSDSHSYLRARNSTH
jgi:hypothetical protein